MSKKIESSVVALLLVFALYCALIVGSSLDEGYEMTRGNERLKYLFSGFSLENYWTSQFDEFYPGFYDTLATFIGKMFPKDFSVKIFHLTNSVFSILTCFGIYKVVSILFNKDVGKIVFILCFLNPIFFGHMAINSKDTIVAFSNVWASYILLRYLKFQSINHDCSKYILLAGLVIGLGTGVRIPFVITLIPILVFVLVDIFFFKSIAKKGFSFNKFIFHLLISLSIAYLVTVSCWPQTHANIFTEPFRLLLKQFGNLSFGVPWMLFNGDIVSTDQLSKIYIPIVFFYKSPEFIIICYFIFFITTFFKGNFYKSKFILFWPKVILILFILFFPTFIYIIFPYKIYDGIRLFLNIIPYFCIIPGLFLYYLMNNLNSYKNKILSVLIFTSLIYYLFIFVSLTPYQYTYLNIFLGDFSKAHKKFENDYWAVSTKELVHKISDSKNTNILSGNKKIAFCGVAHDFTKRELNKIKGFNYEQKGIDETEIDFVIMTNRVVSKDGNDTILNAKTCFDKIEGKDIISVKRNGLLLSTLRKVN